MYKPLHVAYAHYRQGERMKAITLLLSWVMMAYPIARFFRALLEPSTLTLVDVLVGLYALTLALIVARFWPALKKRYPDIIGQPGMYRPRQRIWALCKQGQWMGGITLLLGWIAIGYFSYKMLAIPLLNLYFPPHQAASLLDISIGLFTLTVGLFVAYLWPALSEGHLQPAHEA